jgi:hypothetical protein
VLLRLATSEKEKSWFSGEIMIDRSINGVPEQSLVELANTLTAYIPAPSSTAVDCLKVIRLNTHDPFTDMSTGSSCARPTSLPSIAWTMETWAASTVDTESVPASNREHTICAADLIIRIPPRIRTMSLLANIQNFVLAAFVAVVKQTPVNETKQSIDGLLSPLRS